jgi:hypothetical protein
MEVVEQRRLYESPVFSDLYEKFVAFGALTTRGQHFSFPPQARNYFFLVVVDLKVESVFSFVVQGATIPQPP